MASTFKPALVLMAGRSVAFLGTFVLPLALVRIFDQAAFGTYKQLFLIYATFYSIGQLGMAESLYYFVPRAPRRGGIYVANSMLSLGVAGVIGLGLLCADAPALARWLGNPELARHLPVLGLFVMLMMPTAALETVMIARHRYARGAASYVISDVVRALALLLPALAWRSLDGLLIGATVFAAARLSATLVYLGRAFEGGLRPRAALWREQLAYAVPFGAAGLVETLQLNYHQYAVSHHFDPATFAIYSVGCFQLPLLELVASPLTNVMMVRMAETAGESSAEALAIWAGTTRALALVFFPVLAFLLVAAPEIIVVLFTDAYRASVPIFMIWSLAVALTVLPTDGALRAHAATRFLFVLGAVKLLVVAALIGAFMTFLGLPGAVLVTVLAGVAAKGLALVRLSRLMGASLSRLVPWRDLAGIAAVAAAAAVPVLALKAALLVPPFGRLAVAAPVYGGCYLLALFSFGLLAEDERRAVRARLQRFMPGLVARFGESGS
jgi:O-antigen/teichoic acid export membrane protein